MRVNKKYTGKSLPKINFELRVQFFVVDVNNREMSIVSAGRTRQQKRFDGVTTIYIVSIACSHSIYELFMWFIRVYQFWLTRYHGIVGILHRPTPWTALAFTPATSLTATISYRQLPSYPVDSGEWGKLPEPIRNGISVVGTPNDNDGRYPNHPH